MFLHGYQKFLASLAPARKAKQRSPCAVFACWVEVQLWLAGVVKPGFENGEIERRDAAPKNADEKLLLPQPLQPSPLTRHPKPLSS